MSKVKMFTLLTGAIGETFKSGTREPSGDYVGAADYIALRDALGEALDGWSIYSKLYFGTAANISEDRIDALRSQFLES